MSIDMRSLPRRAGVRRSHTLGIAVAAALALPTSTVHKMAQPAAA